MTEKRFNVKYEVDDGIRYWEIIDNKTQNNTSNEKKLCGWLNELAEENEQLNENNLHLHHELRLKNDRVLKLEKENKELKKQLGREETDKKRLMSYLMRYKGFSFDEIVEDFLDNSYYDNWWEDGFYESCWDDYLEEKAFDGCDD